jgi:hypothetical protein
MGRTGVRGVPEGVHRDDAEQEYRQEQQAAAPCGDSVLFALHPHSSSGLMTPAILPPEGMQIG